MQSLVEKDIFLKRKRKELSMAGLRSAHTREQLLVTSRWDKSFRVNQPFVKNLVVTTERPFVRAMGQAPSINLK